MTQRYISYIPNTKAIFIIYFVKKKFEFLFQPYTNTIKYHGKTALSTVYIYLYKLLSISFRVVGRLTTIWYSINSSERSLLEWDSRVTVNLSQSSWTSSFGLRVVFVLPFSWSPTPAPTCGSDVCIAIVQKLILRINRRTTIINCWHKSMIGINFQEE